jgi:branched-chain amino acid transport system substrate-binding protein
LPQTRETAQAVVKYADSYLGGLDGHPIDLITCEDKSDGASGTACANEFAQDKVAAVVEGQVSNTDLYIPILKGAGIPWIAATGTGQQELASNISFDLGGGLIGILAATAAAAKQAGLKHLVAFGIDVPAFTGLFNALGKALFTKAGVAIDLITLPPGTPDATPQVAAGFAKHPDGVVVFAEESLCKALMPAIHDANTSNATVFMSGLCADPSVVSSIGTAPIDGAIVNGNNVSLGDDAEAKLYRAVMTAYGTPDLAQGDGSVGYVSMLGLIRAVNQVKPAGDLTATVIASAMRSATKVPLPGITGATFTCNDSAIPTLPAVCSTGILFSKVSGSKLVDFHVVDGTSLIKS